jgi:hypothetical protein
MTKALGLIAVMGTSHLACMPDNELVVAQAIEPNPAITAFADLGSSTQGREIVLTGVFPGASPGDYYPEAYCNGTQLPPPTLLSGSYTQQHMRTIEVPTGSACWYRSTYDDGCTTTIVTTNPTLLALGPPEIEIQGINDYGVTSGSHFYALWGTFPGPGSYSPQVYCNSLVTGAPTQQSAVITYGPVGGQINIGFPEPPAGSSCTLRVIRSDGHPSTTWPVRIGAAPSFPTSRGVFGAYHWGGFQPRAYINETQTPAIDRNLPDGVTRMRDAGLRSAVRVVIEPRMRSSGVGSALFNRYNLPVPFCPTPPFPVQQGVGVAVSGTGNITPSWPAHQPNDVGLLIVETANQAVAAPAGWTQVTNSPQGNGTAGSTAATRLTLFWRRATSSNQAAPTIVDPGDHCVAQIITFRGATPTGNPWEATAGNNTATSQTTASIPGANVTALNRLVVAIVSNMTDTAAPQASGWSNPDLDNVAEVPGADVDSASGNGGGFSVATGRTRAIGVYGPTSATLATASRQGRISIALKAAGDGFLACAVDHSLYRAAFDQMGAGSIIVITTMDATSAGEYGELGEEAHYFDEGWLTDNADAVRNEYSGMARRLMLNNCGSSRTFVISNWETENLLYCGSIYAYRNDQDFRDACQTGQLEDPCRDIPSTVPVAFKYLALIRWFDLRRQGIDNGVNAALAQGCTGVSVKDGIEMAALHSLDLLSQTDPIAFRQTVIHDLIPDLESPPSYVTYSAHESFNAGRLEVDLLEIKGLLPPGTLLGIGEGGAVGGAGMADTVTKFETLQWRFLESMKAAWRAQLSHVIVWEAFTSVFSPPNQDLRDGLLDVDGSERPIMTNFRSTMIDYNANGTMPGTTTARIDDVGNQGDVNLGGVWYRRFLLTGNFPTGSQFTPFTWCDGHDVEPANVSQVHG